MKKLIQEGHRRSIWQVLAVYLGASWVVLQVVDVVTQNMGLPTWVFPFAFVLLLLGLPVMLATAIIQGRPTPGAAAAEPSVTESGTPIEAPATERALPDAEVHHRLFTWRNAILGGLGALALFAVVLAGYAYARKAGVGAAGTLVAKGMIDDGERVILATFSGDSAMAEAATMAFRVDLSQSTTVSLADPSFIGRVLERMELPTDTRLDEAVATEAAIREGIKAVVAGDVARVAGGYVFTARVVAAQSGQEMINVRETASDSSQVMEAIDRLSRRTRERLGESLGSINASPPLDRATTTSLEALRKYSQALAAIDESDIDLGRGLLREAVLLDPEFAMAWRKLAVIEFDDQSARKEAATRAFELRDNLTDRERYITEGTYHGYVTTDRDAAINAYRALLDKYPNDSWALNNLAIQYAWQGKMDLSMELLQRSIELDPYSPNAYQNLAGNLHFLNERDSARAVIDALDRQLPDNPAGADMRARMDLAEWDFDGAQVFADSLMRSGISEARRRGLEAQADIDVAKGRLEFAERRWLDARTETDPVRHADWLSWIDLLIRVDPDRAAATMEAALSTGAVIDTANGSGGRAWLFAHAGRPEDARFWLAADRRADNRYSSAPAPIRAAEDAWFESAVAMGEGRYEDAVRHLQTAEREFDLFFDGLGVRNVAWDLARAFDAAGLQDSAVARYEQALEFTNLYEVDDEVLVIATTYSRLATLYDQIGDLEQAAGYYARFVDLWTEADPEFQPRVRAAQVRLDEIVRERG